MCVCQLGSSHKRAYLAGRTARMLFLAIALGPGFGTLSGTLTPVRGQESKPADAAPAETETQARFARFAQQLSGAVMEGNFTVDGQRGDLKQERYELESVTKMPLGDLWLFKTRIRYGDHDVTVPLPINVAWAGETPMIVVDQLTVPGLGTFDARVVIAGERYAGTWQHGEVGGHLFGKIVPPATPTAGEKSAADETAPTPAAK